MARKISKELEEKIISSFKQEGTAKRVSETLDMHLSTIYRILKKNSVGVYEQDWTDGEIEILKNFYSDKGSAFCADKTGRTINAVFGKANKLGLKVKTIDDLFNDEQVKFLTINYPKLGSVKCAEILKMPRNQVENKAHNLGLKRDFNSVPEGFRMCGACKNILAISEFSPKGDNRSRSNYCRPCKRKYDKKSVMKHCKNPAWQRHKTISNLLYGSRLRASQKNLPHDIDYEWIDKNLGDKCPILNEPYILANGTATFKRLSPSIDRIHPSDGYEKSRCVIISHRANTIKNDATLEELIRIVEFYTDLKRKNVDYEI